MLVYLFINCLFLDLWSEWENMMFLVKDITDISKQNFPVLLWTLRTFENRKSWDRNLRNSSCREGILGFGVTFD
jgi:hypothetical protein